MPINVEHNVDPRLLGQAAYQAGQGMGTQDALRLLARYGGRGGGAPQQQNFNMGSLPQSGVGQVSDAIANGDAGGDQGLRQDMSIREGDTGGSLYDPSLNPPPTPDAPNPNSIYNPDGTTNANFYGGAEGDAAYQQGLQDRGAPLDDASQAREDSYNKRIEMLHNDDRFDQSVKDDAIKKILTEKQKALAARPYTFKKSTQEQFDNQLVQHPDGSSYIQQPDGSFTPHAPEPPPDPTPIDPTNPTSMQPTSPLPMPDPSEPPKSQFQQHFEQSIVRTPDGQVGTWDGKKFTPLEKPEKKPATTVKDETWAQFSKDYDAAHKHLKHLTKTDDDGKVTEPSDEDILNHLQKKREAFQKATGRIAHADVPTQAPAQDQHDDSVAQQQTPALVQTAEQHAALPRGAQYMDAQGNIRIKQ